MNKEIQPEETNPLQPQQPGTADQPELQPPEPDDAPWQALQRLGRGEPQPGDRELWVATTLAMRNYRRYLRNNRPDLKPKTVDRLANRLLFVRTARFTYIRLDEWDAERSHQPGWDGKRWYDKPDYR